MARWTNAEKSGLATGKRTEPTISPPASLTPSWNAAFGVVAGAEVRDHGVDFLEPPFFAAQVPSVWFSIGVVTEVRAM